MTAREMFEELGYKVKENKSYIEYENDEEHYFIFNKDYKNISIGAYEIDIDEFKAVQQQIKELGWI